MSIELGNHPRVTLWRLRTRELRFERLPRLMGIVNVTPDSFSDGGKFFSPQAAIERGLRLLADGADILDIGGESTRPYSQGVGAVEELDRVAPVIEGILAAAPRAILSIDTSKSAVARAAADAGVEILNDVTGLEGDAAMPEVAVEYGLGVCAMHMRGTPQTMQDDPEYGDVVGEIRTYLQQRRDALLAAGVQRERICLDPGIGFGKTHEHNWTLLSHAAAFHEIGCPLLVGHSRKGFLGNLLGDKTVDRDGATAGAAAALATQGVQVLRVHNVRLVREVLMGWDAGGGRASKY